MKNWRVKLTAGAKTLADVKIKRDIFQRDALSPLLPVKPMMPLTYILRKFTGALKFTKSQEKINHLMYTREMTYTVCVNIKTNKTTITRKQKWEEKQLYGYFKRAGEIAHEKIRIWLRKGNLKRGTESFWKAAQNNDLRTNYITTKIDNVR